jgi:hypothetical protein
VVINEEVYGQVTPSMAVAMIDEIELREKAA